MRKSGGMEGYPEPLCAFFCRMQAADFGVTSLTPVTEKIRQIIFEGQLHNWQVDILKVAKAFFSFALFSAIKIYWESGIGILDFIEKLRAT